MLWLISSSVRFKDAETDSIMAAFDFSVEKLMLLYLHTGEDRAGFIYGFSYSSIIPEPKTGQHCQGELEIVG